MYFSCSRFCKPPSRFCSGITWSTDILGNIPMSSLNFGKLPFFNTDTFSCQAYNDDIANSSFIRDSRESQFLGHCPPLGLSMNVPPRTSPTDCVGSSVYPSLRASCQPVQLQRENSSERKVENKCFYRLRKLPRGLQRDVVYLGWPLAASHMIQKAGGGEELQGLSQPMSAAVQRRPNKLWRSNSIFNLWSYQTYQNRGASNQLTWARIFKLLMIPRIYSKEPIPQIKHCFNLYLYTVCIIII